MIIFILFVMLFLTSCTTSTTEYIAVRPIYNIDTLRQCALPTWLPEDAGEAVLVLWERLQICVEVTTNMIEQLEATNTQ